MRKKLPWLLFVCLLVFAAVFIPLTTLGLPEQVASHFGNSGLANDFMSRPRYLVFMLAFSIGLPVCVVTLLVMVFRRTNRFNLPNRAYWLAPEHMDQTREFLVLHAVCFGCLLVTFMCLIHWLVVNANTVQPPRLSDAGVIAIACVFLVGMATWAVALPLHFRRQTEE